MAGSGANTQPGLQQFLYTLVPDGPDTCLGLRLTFAPLFVILAGNRGHHFHQYGVNRAQH
ncbi:hypothetical protein ALP18_200020 [Pseudomonas amygdali pv. myricae]|nr:hypothetical protein ALP18_200020 [Pseudomonas amygdali pv. myricae]